MNKLSSISILLILFLTSCLGTDGPNLRDHIDHWEISRTFKTYNKSKLDIDNKDNEYKVVRGHNQVLLITTERTPIFKEGKELTDLYSEETILIELDTSDNLVSASNPSNSKLLRLLLAFSPDYGINPLHKDENITLKRKDSTLWTIDSEVSDFEFNAELDFNSKQVLTETHNHY